MKQCIVCTGEIADGYIEYSSGNTWCADACWEIDFTKKELAAGLECGELAFESWEVVPAVVYAEQLEMEIGRVETV